ncbi:hypothetical protein EYF80_015240 [Liparis tanakae]|uniref:Uncharacterized protein n=1 Tax=Liparis tanakae TaxID=230148 RepID=A0A4Z2I9A1_9TELE|nr:hypothetical protein EYF80_015240 [Liparis tanakae]
MEVERRSGRSISRDMAPNPARSNGPYETPSPPDLVSVCTISWSRRASFIPFCWTNPLIMGHLDEAEPTTGLVRLSTYISWPWSSRYSSSCAKVGDADRDGGLRGGTESVEVHAVLFVEQLLAYIQNLWLVEGVGRGGSEGVHVQTRPELGRVRRRGHVDGQVEGNPGHAAGVPGFALVAAGMRYGHVAEEEHAAAHVRVEAVPLAALLGPTHKSLDSSGAPDLEPGTAGQGRHHSSSSGPEELAVGSQLLDQASRRQLGLAVGGFLPGHLRLRVSRRLAGHPEALP